MAETIENLYIGLGLKEDKASFDRGIAQFRNLRGAAVMAGTAIGAAVGGAAVVQKAAETRNALALQAEALGFNADEADRLGHALEQLGGSSGNAINVLQQMRDLRDEAAFGEGALFDVGMFGIDSAPMIQAQDELSALLELSRQFQSLDDTQIARAMSALGFEGTGIANLLRGGPDAFQGEIDRAGALREITNAQLEASNELVRATNEFSRALDASTDALVEDLAPWITRLVEFGTDVLQGDAEITPGRNNILPGGTGNLPGQEPQSSTNMRDNADFRAKVAQMERDIGAPAGMLWAQLGVESSYNTRAVSPAGARGLAQVMPDTEASLEERFGRDLDPFDPNDALKMQAELMRENFAASGSWREALRMYHGGWDRSNWGPRNEEYAPSVMGRMGPQASISATFHIHDARDPDAVARTVRGEIRRMADNTASDYRNPVS